MASVRIVHSRCMSGAAPAAQRFALRKVLQRRGAARCGLASGGSPCGGQSRAELSQPARVRGLDGELPPLAEHCHPVQQGSVLKEVLHRHGAAPIAEGDGPGDIRAECRRDLPQQPRGGARLHRHAELELWAMVHLSSNLRSRLRRPQRSSVGTVG